MLVSAARMARNICVHTPGRLAFSVGARSGMSDLTILLGNIGTFYAATLPDTTQLASKSEPKQTLRSEEDGAGLDNPPKDVFNNRFGIQSEAIKAAAANARQVIALLQVAQAALKLIDPLVDELQSLAAQAADSDLSDHERAILDFQCKEKRDEIDAIANDANFQGQQLLAADKTFSVKVGSGDSSDDSFDITLLSALSGSLATGLDTASLDSFSNAQSAQTLAETAQNAIADRLSSVSGNLKRLGYAAQNLSSERAATLELAEARQLAMRVSDELVLSVKFSIPDQVSALVSNFRIISLVA